MHDARADRRRDARLIYLRAEALLWAVNRTCQRARRAVPVQFARAVGPTLGLAVYDPPISVPVPDIKLYWHSRHDKNLAHRWLRQEIQAAVRAI